MNPSDQLLALHRVSCVLGRHTVLSNATLRVGRGDFTGIVGPSGSGKTTMLRALLSTVRPASGWVERAADMEQKVTEAAAARVAHEQEAPVAQGVRPVPRVAPVHALVE